MARQIKHFWTNIAVGILGLFVGIDNLLRWINDNLFTQGLVIGALCTILAAIWIVYVFAKRNTDE